MNYNQLNNKVRIDILTCLPQLLTSFFSDSILKRAIQKELVEVHFHQLREYAVNKHNQIDDYAYGGGAGMVLMIEPVVKCIRALQEKRHYEEIIYMAPDGVQLSQGIANELSLKGNIMILCGHYKGIDERIRTHFITREISIGDYVLSGGELPAAVLSDAIVRLIPGVLTNADSALTDSFQDNLVAPPVYTRPCNFEGLKVPDILRSGNEKEIRLWREEQAFIRTKNKRPGLVEKHIK